jgi:hypothetical protein
MDEARRGPPVAMPQLPSSKVGHSCANGACRMKESPERRCLRYMITRCHNPRNHSYSRYGARGVRVCREWRRNPQLFLAHVGRKPSPEHSIDRFPNPAGNYEPGNVRWATKKEQNRNTQTNVWIEHKGQRKIASDWAAEIGMSVALLHDRLKRGWSTERALLEPVSRNRWNRPEAQ